MKNKNGWGLGMMILLMSVLLIALIVVVIMVYNLYAYNDELPLNNNNINIIERIK